MARLALHSPLDLRVPFSFRNDDAAAAGQGQSGQTAVGPWVAPLPTLTGDAPSAREFDNEITRPLSLAIFSASVTPSAATADTDTSLEMDRIPGGGRGRSLDAHLRDLDKVVRRRIAESQEIK